MSKNKKINPTHQDLVQAFKDHYRVSDHAYTRPYKLLKFYAAECGVKALFLRQHSLPNINSINSGPYAGLLSKHGHSISHWVRECSIPSFLFCPDENHGMYPIKELHERLRYGVSMDNHFETQQLRCLKLLNEELKNLI